jgi:hypothetical protein
LAGVEISISVPDDLAEQLRSGWGDLPRHALEALAADAYREGLLTAGQVRRLLGFRTRLELDAFLKEAGAFLHYTGEDLEEDARTLDRLLAS